MLAYMQEVQSRLNLETEKSAIDKAREIALVTQVAPVLFMAGLVSATILIIGKTPFSSLFQFWLMGQILICGILFLLSTREKSELFEGQRDAQSLVKSFPFVALAVSWGVVPGGLTLLESMPPEIAFGAILSGATLSSAVLLQYMPGLGRLILAATVGGFLANAFIQAEFVSSLISLIMLAYFAGLAICTRWYFSGYNKRLTETETAAERNREINSVLRDVGFATDTFFWSTDDMGRICELNNDEMLETGLRALLVGEDWLSLFRPSAERELLRARTARGSEIVALELELADEIEAEARYWKLSARPIFEKRKFTGYRGSATDISQLRLSEKRAAFLTEYDVLTGLLNRRSFKEALSAHLDSEIRHTSECALIWIDLDNFKWINDTFGHEGGDEVIKLFAKRLELLCEPMDLLCRFGGDEFALLVSRSLSGGRLIKFMDDLTESL